MGHGWLLLARLVVGKASTKGGIWHMYYLTAGRQLLLLLLATAACLWWRKGKPNTGLCRHTYARVFIARLNAVVFSTDQP